MLDSNFVGMIERIVRDRLSASVIDSVDVKSDVDSEGDPILRVTIVFDQTEQGLDQNRVVGLVRHIRSNLEGEGGDRFPLISFIAKNEAAKLKRASA